MQKDSERFFNELEKKKGFNSCSKGIKASTEMFSQCKLQKHLLILVINIYVKS